VQPVSITTKVVSSNPTHGGAYSIQHYVIKCVSDLRQVADFFPGQLMKVKTDIFLPSSSWRPIRLMKVKTDIFLPCHQVGDLLDL